MFQRFCATRAAASKPDHGAIATRLPPFPVLSGVEAVLVCVPVPGSVLLETRVDDPVFVVVS